MHSTRWALQTTVGIVSLLASGPCPLGAQVIPLEPITPAQCEAALLAFQSHPRDHSAWYRLPGCGALGGNALARAIRSAGARTDSGWMFPLYLGASEIRDSAVFNAALTVAGSTTATPEARVIAFLIGLSQLNRAIGIDMRVEPEALWTTGTPRGCPLSSYTDEGVFFSTTFLSPEADQQLAATADEVRYSDAPLVVRAFAGCIRMMMFNVPVVVRDSLITMIYTCGNRFRVENRDREYLAATWHLATLPDSGWITVGPYSSFTFTTRSVGNVRLYQNGKLVATRDHGGIVC